MSGTGCTIYTDKENCRLVQGRIGRCALSPVSAWAKEALIGNLTDFRRGFSNLRRSAALRLDLPLFRGREKTSNYGWSVHTYRRMQIRVVPRFKSSR